MYTVSVFDHWGTISSFWNYRYFPITNCDAGRCLDFGLKHLAGDQEHYQLWETIVAREGRNCREQGLEQRRQIHIKLNQAKRTCKN